jgi:hypothetical protein
MKKWAVQKKDSPFLVKEFDRRRLHSWLVNPPAIDGYHMFDSLSPETQEIPEKFVRHDNN